MKVEVPFYFFDESGSIGSDRGYEPCDVTPLCDQVMAFLGTISDGKPADFIVNMGKGE